MLTVTQLSPRALEIVAEGHIRSDEVGPALDAIGRMRERSDRIDLLVDVRGGIGLDLGVITAELTRLPELFQLVRALDRVAVIADEAWVRSASRIESALIPGVAYEVYRRDEADRAHAWVLREAARPHAGALMVFDPGIAGTIGLEVRGRIEKEDVADVRPAIEVGLDDPANRRMMARVARFDGFDPALLADGDLFRLKKKGLERIERYAIVGGPDWMHGASEWIDPLLKMDIRHFDASEEAAALAWLNS